MIVALLIILIFAVLFPGVLRALFSVMILVTLWQLWFGEPDDITVKNPTTTTQLAKPGAAVRRVQ